MSIGLGYKGACQLRIDEGYTTQQQNGQGYEEPGHERYCLYFGRSHIQDHETDAVSYTHLTLPTNDQV